ncbi:methyl-accepting chemotaxis protein [Brevibacillus dissolubilis]|uniref:methyl-accepting chemotaxis protein n=1 Tax=Brevibacillus dissolubilis TaxID=1844116 RepID=UPI0011171861|nr:methyl-accepting chemotaxis protein [Brevibacillus dissolubilis]
MKNRGRSLVKYVQEWLRENSRTDMSNSLALGRIRNSIATKMIIFGIVMVLVIFLTLQFIAFTYSKATLTNITSKETKMLAEQHSQSINDWVNTLTEAVNETAKRRVLTTDIDTLVMEQFKNLKQSYKEITKVYLIDTATGKDIYSLTGRSGTDFRTKEYFKKAMEKKELVISDEEFTPNAERSFLYIASPVGDAGKTDRILVVAFSINQLVEKLEKVPFMQNGYAFVVKGDGLVVAHKDKKQNSTVELAKQGEYAEMLELMKQGKSESVVYKDNGVEAFAAFAPIETLGWNFVMTTSTDEIYGEVYNMTWVILLLSIPVSGIACVLIWWFANKIRRSLYAIARYMQRVGEGDLQVHANVKGHDEIALVGRAMNHMVGELRNLLANVHDKATQLHIATDELNMIAQENRAAIDTIQTNITTISDRVVNQTNEVQSTATTVSEISEGVEQVATAAESTSIATSRTFDRAQDGSTLVQEVIHVVRMASEQVARSNVRMQSLRQRSSEITEIVKMMTAIASQTNLLALNASIEAARAGEAGRGFSVVANEVRKLAEESSEFSDRIALIARSINQEAQEMSHNMDSIVTMVSSGLVSVENVGHAFDQILGDIQAAASQSESMTAISEEMAAGNQVVTSSMMRLSNMSGDIQTSITGVVETIDEQLMAISKINEEVDHLKQMADELNENIQRFTI